MMRALRVVAWLAAAGALGTVIAGLLGPHLGDDPGLPGAAGFAIEVIGAMWLQGGALTALVAGGAWLLRCRAQAMALAAVALIILLPEAWIRSTARGPSPGGPTLRIAAANLAEQNEHDPGMLAALLALDADVLVLPEYTRSWARRLEAALAQHYPHRFVGQPAPAPPGLSVDGMQLAIWSRLPPAGEPEVRHFSSYGAQVRVPLRWQGREFALYGIHPLKPFPRLVFHRAHRDRGELLAWLAGERLPIVIAGDFNATPRSALFVRLRRAGLRSASEDVLGAAPVTFPTVPPRYAFFRVAIDHVLSDDRFEAVAFEVAAPTRSDHRAVVATLRWRDR